MKYLLILLLTGCSSLATPTGQAITQTGSAIYQSQVQPMPFYLPYIGLYADKIMYYARSNN